MVVQSDRARLHRVLYTFVTFQSEKCASVLFKMESVPKSANGHPYADGLFQVSLREDRDADTAFCHRKKRHLELGDPCWPDAVVIDEIALF